MTLAVPAKKAMHKAPASDASQGVNKGKHAWTVSTSKPQKPRKKPEEWTQVKQKVRKPKVRQLRNDAIVIAASAGGSYADILKKVKAEPQLKELGQAVQAVRRTAKGELLVILNKVSDPKTVELQTTMKAVLGNNVDVRALTETMLIQLWRKGAPSQRLQSKILLHAMQTQKGERLRSPNNEWGMPVLQKGYARA